jgi:hypothetical protein
MQCLVGGSLAVAGGLEIKPSETIELKPGSGHDAKPENQDLTISYIVEAFVAHWGKNSELESKQVKVAGRIISDIFHSDLHVSKNVDRDLGASYNTPPKARFHCSQL